MAGKLALLKTDKDFAGLRGSKFYNTAFLKLRWSFSSRQNSPRFGFIIPKKEVSKVVDRNKIKRRLKAILIKSLKQLSPADILIFPRKQILALTFTSLEQEVVKIFKSAKLWKS
ncbi:MAG TPA: ribonuclease P protein component [Patescibacteria group bacterium]|jgi:ribonuclease P protein component|nr:ribonuclease P protein component [Patescibacteria group bacterium]